MLIRHISTVHSFLEKFCCSIKYFQSIPQRFHCSEPQASTFLRAVYTSISTCSTNRLEELISCFMRFMLKKINFNRSVIQKREKEGKVGNTRPAATQKVICSELQTWVETVLHPCKGSAAPVPEFLEESNTLVSHQIVQEPLKAPAWKARN